VGVPIQKENEAPLIGSPKGSRMGRKMMMILASSDSGVWESVVSAGSGVLGGAPAVNRFIVI